MKKILLTAALVAASSVGLQADIARTAGSLTTLAGWDFNGPTAASTSSVNARYSQSQGTGTTYYSAGTAPSPGNAAYGTVYFSGSNGGTFASARGIATSNAPSYDLLSTDGLFSNNNSLGDQSATNPRSILLSNTSTLDNGRASFKLQSVSDFNTFTDLSLAYSARNGGSDFATISWSYSFDGANFTSIAGTSSQIDVSGAAYSVFTADLSSITAINGQANLWLGMDYVENSAGASVFIDNVAIYGVAAAIPEPSTYAAILGAISLGFVMIRRRFQAKAV